MILHQIDGIPGPNFQGVGHTRAFNSGPNNARRFTIEILPGRHVLKVGFRDIITDPMNFNRSIELSSPEDQTLLLETRAGEVYEIDANYSFKIGGFSWSPYCKKVGDK